MGRPTTAVLLVLAAAAGTTDAISYLGLGRVFPANMTGNTVLLGIGIADGDYDAAARSAVALAGFLVGAAVTAFAVTSPDNRHRLTRGLTGELAVLAAACGLWLATGDRPAAVPQHVLIALVSLAMGAQSATVISLDVGVSTTFITGTWTAVSRRVGGWLRRRVTGWRLRRVTGWRLRRVGGRLHRAAGDGAAGRQPDRSERQSLVPVTYFGAALAAGYAEQASRAFAALIPLALVTAALVAAVLCRVAVRSGASSTRAPT